MKKYRVVERTNRVEIKREDNSVYIALLISKWGRKEALKMASVTCNFLNAGNSETNEKRIIKI